MVSFYTKIGEHLLHMTIEDPDLMLMFQNNFYLFASNSLDKTDMAVTIRSGFGDPFMDFNVKITKMKTTITFSRADYEIQVDVDYTQAKICVHDELALKHALMNLYSSYIVKNNWGLLIHSSCVIERGEAHMFAGKSGAGKSTAAALSQPRPLLSDEATLVKIGPGQRITVFNSPFRSDVKPTAYLGSCSLASIHLLKQSPTTKRFLMRKADALMNLIDKVFYWDHCKQETIQVMTMLKTLVLQTPVYELYFQKNNAFWELIS